MIEEFEVKFENSSRTGRLFTAQTIEDALAQAMDYGDVATAPELMDGMRYADFDSPYFSLFSLQTITTMTEAIVVRVPSDETGSPYNLNGGEYALVVAHGGVYLKTPDAISAARSRLIRNNSAIALPEDSENFNIALQEDPNSRIYTLAEIMDSELDLASQQRTYRVVVPFEKARADSTLDKFPVRIAANLSYVLCAYAGSWKRAYEYTINLLRYDIDLYNLRDAFAEAGIEDIPTTRHVVKPLFNAGQGSFVSYYIMDGSATFLGLKRD